MTAEPLPDTASQSRERERQLAALLHEAHAHPAVHHPFLSRFAAAAFTDQRAALRTYAREYCGYSAWFPRYLAAVIERLPDPAHRQLLQQNLDEEQGQLTDEDCTTLAAAGIDPASIRGIPHARLFRSFCASIGLTEDELVVPTPAAARWRTRLLDYLQKATPAAAVGALGFGTEHVVRPIYRQLIAGIRQVWGLARPDYVFFELHHLVDDQHQQDLLAIAGELASSPGELAELRLGMATALRLRVEFWDSLLQTLDQPLDRAREESTR